MQSVLWHSVSFRTALRLQMDSGSGIHLSAGWPLRLQMHSGSRSLLCNCVERCGVCLMSDFEVVVMLFVVHLREALWYVIDV